MMRFGIPAYRLPRGILRSEIERIENMGVTIELNTKVENVDKEIENFDAIFLAVGAQIGKNVNIPAGSAANMVDAVSVLRGVTDEDAEDKPLLGRRVYVYGGGNTAVDVARTARRLGASESVILYRRTRDQMPAHDSEVKEAEEEGVLMRWLSTVKHVDQGEIQIEKMELDENGFPQPTGEYETLQGDSLIMALGQDADLSLVENDDEIEISNGVVQVLSLIHI